MLIRSYRAQGGGTSNCELIVKMTELAVYIYTMSMTRMQLVANSPLATPPGAPGITLRHVSSSGQPCNGHFGIWTTPKSDRIVSHLELF